MERGDLLLEGDLLLGVALAGGLLLDEVAEVVPPVALLEKAGERGAGRLVAAVDGQELLPGVDGAVDVAQVAFAQAGHLAQPLLARVLRFAGHPERREQHVA